MAGLLANNPPRAWRHQSFGRVSSSCGVFSPSCIAALMLQPLLAARHLAAAPRCAPGWHPVLVPARQVLHCPIHIATIQFNGALYPARTLTTAMAAPQPAGPEASADYQQYLDVAVAAAKEAGSIIAAAWNQPKRVEHKGTFDLVTETDKQCESVVHARLSAAFPSHSFIGEEGSSAQGFTAELTEEPTWMVDPVDGTTNFVHRFPFSCVSIGLAIRRRVVAGVVYNPILDEMFTATRGGGAFRNGQRISVSDTATLQSAVFATEVGTSREDAFLDACFDRMRTLTKHMRSVRCCGSCALNLCSVACGRLDAYYELGLGGCWDLAAATLVLKEAGGRVLDPTGGPFNIMSRRVLGTNAHLAEPISTLLAGAKYADSEPKAIPPPQ